MVIFPGVPNAVPAPFLLEDLAPECAGCGDDTHACASMCRQIGLCDMVM